MELYKHLILMKKLPLTIESTFAYDDYLLVGTREGHLLMYKIDIKSKTPSEYEFKPHLLRSAKQFSKKPIVQIEAIPDYRILVSLSDNVISIHNLDKISFPLISTLNKTKNATFFSLEVNRLSTLSGQIQCTVRMVVALKTILMFFYWKNNEFFELRPNIKLPDVARVAVWCSNRVFVGLRSQYVQVDIEQGVINEMFPVTSEPLIVSLSAENNFALCRDKKTYILDKERRPLLEYAISWNDQPLSIADDLLFLTAIEPYSNIEILTNCVRDSMREHCIQRIDLSSQIQKPLKTIAKWRNRPGQLILNSESDIVMLKIVSWEQQLQILQNEKYFELALKMIEFYNSNKPQLLKGDLKPLDLEENDKLKLKIRKYYALDLFCRHKFSESISLFQSLKTDPSYVIALYPDILPEEYRMQQLKDSQIILPELEGSVLERSLMALVDYLVEVRAQVNKEITNERERQMELRKLYELQSIVDTSLLKCYLHTNESLVASLLRIENHCHLEETEKALKKKQKYDELIILYKTKGLHRNALDLLQRQARYESKNPIKSRRQLVSYLQELGKSHLNLLFEYSNWLLSEYPDEGLTVFTDDLYLDTPNELPREEVLHYLERIDSNLVIAYLEHCIFNWKEVSGKFHDTLVNKYREKIRPLMAIYQFELNHQKQENSIEILDSNQNNDISDEDLHSLNRQFYLRPKPAGQEPGELGGLRLKLMHLLEISDHYNKETLPTYLLHDGLFDERAIVLGKIGNYREALMIYIHVLNDLERAEEFCLKQFDKFEQKKSQISSAREVFLFMFEHCLVKPIGNELQDYQNQTFVKSFYSNLSLLLPKSVLGILKSTNNDLYLDSTGKTVQLPMNVRISLAILSRHSRRINFLEAIKLLSDHLPLSALAPILIKTMRHVCSEKNQMKILRELLHSQRLKIHSTRIALERLNVVRIDGTELCQICMKRIGKSVFVRYTNKDLVHLGCRQIYDESNQIKS